MGTIVDVSDAEWEQVADLFDPDLRRGAPEVYPRRLMVEAMLWMARTGIQWRYLPERFPPWTAVWSQWRRWRANGVWAAAMGRLARTIRMDKERHPEPSMLMVDAQTAKGGRAGPTFHAAGGRGGRTVGTKRSILVDILGLPFACRVDPARPHDLASARLLLADELPAFPRLRALVADRAYRGLAKLTERHGLALDIKAPPPGRGEVRPHPAARQGRARIRPARTLAAPVALLRADRGVGQGLARGGGHGLPVREDADRARLTDAPGPTPRPLGPGAAKARAFRACSRSRRRAGSAARERARIYAPLLSQPPLSAGQPGRRIRLQALS
jgi:putative transposase